MKRKLLVDVVTAINDVHLTPVIDVINDSIVLNAMPAEIDARTRSIATIILDLDGAADPADFTRFAAIVRKHAEKVS